MDEVKYKWRTIRYLENRFISSYYHSTWKKLGLDLGLKILGTGAAIGIAFGAKELAEHIPNLTQIAETFPLIAAGFGVGSSGSEPVEENPDYLRNIKICGLQIRFKYPR